MTHKIRSVVTINALRIIYYCFVHSDLQYCTVSNGTAYDSVLQRLNTMHDNVSRALTSSYVECHITPLYEQPCFLKRRMYIG